MKEKRGVTEISIICANVGAVNFHSTYLKSLYTLSKNAQVSELHRYESSEFYEEKRKNRKGIRHLAESREF